MMRKLFFAIIALSSAIYTAASQAKEIDVSGVLARFQDPACTGRDGQGRALYLPGQRILTIEESSAGLVEEILQTPGLSVLYRKDPRGTQTYTKLIVQIDFSDTEKTIQVVDGWKSNPDVKIACNPIAYMN